jgi:hypothetical protein
MSMEQFYSQQAAQMFLSGIEFIALLTGFLIAVALLIWSGGAIWIAYSERRQRRGRRYH